MANKQLIYTCTILFVLTAFGEILFTEGRQLKAVGKEEYNSIQDEKETGRCGSQAINSCQNTVQGYDLPAPTASLVPTIDHSLMGKTDTPPTTTPKQSVGIDDSVADEDDFRPTEPGNSPGIGHSFAGQKDDDQTNTNSNGTGVSHSVAENTPDFQFNIPQSPGIDHSFQNTNAEENP